MPTAASRTRNSREIIHGSHRQKPTDENSSRRQTEAPPAPAPADAIRSRRHPAVRAAFHRATAAAPERPGPADPGWLRQAEKPAPSPGTAPRRWAADWGESGLPRSANATTPRRGPG